MARKKAVKKLDLLAEWQAALQFLAEVVRGEAREPVTAEDGSREAGLKERLKAAELIVKGCGAVIPEPEKPKEEPWQVEIAVVDGGAEQIQLWPNGKEQESGDKEENLPRER